MCVHKVELVHEVGNEFHLPSQTGVWEGGKKMRSQW
jgi:hypothetical protein